MAAYTQGRPLTESRAESAMSRTVRSCRVSDNINVACKVMRTNQTVVRGGEVRRHP